MNNKILLFCSFLMSSCHFFSSKEPTLTTDDNKALYAIGAQVAENLKVLQLSKNELDVVIFGLEDSLKDKPKEDAGIFFPYLEKFSRERTLSAAEKNKRSGKTYEEKKLGEGFKQSSSGLLYKISREGNENRAAVVDSVMITYNAYDIQGNKVDSSGEEKLTVPMSAIIKGWREGLTLIGERGEIELITPSDLAYGDGGSYPRIPGGSTLYFKVQLYKVEKN